MPNAVKHTLFILAPLVVVFAVAPGVYQNHLLLFNFVIFLILFIVSLVMRRPV